MVVGKPYRLLTLPLSDIDPNQIPCHCGWGMENLRFNGLKKAYPPTPT